MPDPSNHSESTNPTASESSASPPENPDETGPDFGRAVDGLLPAIAQDARSGRVLMMAWMNPIAFAETQQTGQAVYFSRSRGKLWRKGETSGHRQKVLEIRLDCDRDVILLQVEQTDAACHNGYESCFYRRVEQDGSLTITDQRLVDPATVYSSNNGNQ